MVLLLVAYDVNTKKKEGQSRLRKVAKTCEGNNYARRIEIHGHNPTYFNMGEDLIIL